ncbi:Cytochrome P450 9e2 [Cryptotermes secundus]|uniref:Cytochrome P450 9e2 n=1 Tax=Cryptotermes secundus TaxID=105785 RepID=A0A2J7PTU9_9NEOP|nr:cytochrome P450 9e2 isoform X2 [Cryptotermes secundus]PNF19766.1 Cytochrome P450 9e2 [Cryptotermes secundus]
MVLWISFEALCIITPLLLWGLYWYCTMTFNYWKKKRIHYIEPVILFGNIKDRALFRTSFHEFQKELYRRFDGHKYAGFYEGRQPVLMIRDPELIKLIMIRDFEHFVDRATLGLSSSPYFKNMLINIKGQQWKNLRALMTPTFSSGKLKAMEILVEQCGQQLGTFLQNESNKNRDDKCTELEMKELFGRFTLDVIATCAFGVQCDSLKDRNAEFVKTAARFNDISLLNRLLIFFVILFCRQYARFFPIRGVNRQAMAFLVDVLKKTVEHRRQHKEQKWNDFLQLMIDAAAQERGERSDEKQDINDTKQTSATVLNEETIIAQSLLFLLAGFETSSTLLTYASYELALNQDIQQKLRKEVEDVLGKYGGHCSYEALLEMTYLEMVLLESLRKYPPVARVDRACTQPYIIPGTNIELEVGTSVCIPILGLHHDPQYYPQPEVFDPNRFTPAQKLTRSPYVFLPFGSGPRNCIGTRFALMTTKIAMVHLIKDFCLQPSMKTDVPLKFSKFSTFLKAENGVWLNIKRNTEI